MQADNRIRQALVSRALGLLPRSALPGLAADLMVAGLDTPSLLELSISDPDHDDLDALFRRMMQELHVQDVGREQALREYAAHVSDRVLHGACTPYEGAKEIWSVLLKNPVQGFHELDGFVYSASEMEDRPEDKEFFERAIRIECEKWSKEKQSPTGT
jgi:hypothetical protein